MGMDQWVCAIDPDGYEGPMTRTIVESENAPNLFMWRKFYRLNHAIKRITECDVSDYEVVVLNLKDVDAVIEEFLKEEDPRDITLSWKFSCLRAIIESDQCLVCYGVSY